MTNPKKPDHIPQEDWDAVNSPELDDDFFAKARPVSEAHPALAEESRQRQRGQRGPQKTPVKVPVKLRLDPDLVERYRATGRGWQTRMNDALRRGIERQT